MTGLGVLRINVQGVAIHSDTFVKSARLTQSVSFIEVALN